MAALATARAGAGRRRSRCRRSPSPSTRRPGEVLALFERHRVEDDWSCLRLYDARGLTGKPTANELRLLMSLDTAHRSHVAFENARHVSRPEQEVARDQRHTRLRPSEMEEPHAANT
jgi:hypothetical protein